MSDFGETISPVAAKDHRCEWCAGPIPKGEKHKQYKGIYDGEWQNWRMHDECYEAQQKEAIQGYCEFMPGDGEMHERVKRLLGKTKIKEAL